MFNTGKKVYFGGKDNEFYTGIITEIIKNNEKISYTVDLIEGGYGQMTVPADICYGTMKECFDAYDEYAEKKIAGYLENIKTVADLALFCMRHTVTMAEEHTDAEAREAARRAAVSFGLMADNDYMF